MFKTCSDPDFNWVHCLCDSATWVVKEPGKPIGFFYSRLFDDALSPSGLGFAVDAFRIDEDGTLDDFYYLKANYRPVFRQAVDLSDGQAHVIERTLYAPSGYDPEQVSLDALLLAYFYVIDPTVQNRQGNDRGSQYQTGVYFTNESARETVKRIAEIERGRSEKFFVEIGPLKNYYPAEEYHQNYLEKNPNGYCHIPRAEMELFSRLRIDPGDYQKPAAESIRDKLTAEQYRVTQESGTEHPFTGEFWDKFEKGIYVDVVTGEPLFSSTDKYESGCGWPAFTKPIEGPAVVEKEDLSHGMRRTEVRSRAGDSHLGHVFTGDPESPNGVRYCINSAALRFVPYEKMETEGYGYLLYLFEK